MRPQRGCRQPHGTTARYVAGCSCLECCNEWRAYQARRKELGERTTVDADESRRIITRLRSKGMSRRAIGEAAGLSYRCLRAIESGESKRVRQETAEAIAAVVPLPSRSNAYIPAGPTLAIIQKARKRGRGWVCKLARASGMDHTTLPKPDQRCVFAKTALAIQEGAVACGLMHGESGGMVTPDVERLKAARYGVFADEALERAYWRAMQGAPVTMRAYARLCAELGVTECA